MTEKNKQPINIVGDIESSLRFAMSSAAQVANVYGSNPKFANMYYKIIKAVNAYEEFTRVFDYD